MSLKYKKIGIGGTFDRLHSGHKKLLKTAFDISETVVIGVTVDSYVSGKVHAKILLSYKQRLEELKHYLDFEGYKGRYSLVSLSDMYGPTLTDTSIEAILVSTETQSGAQAINSERLKKNLPQLPIEMITLYGDQNNIPLSSTRVRQGKVNQAGLVYDHIFFSTLEVTDKQKIELKKPMGITLKENEVSDYIQNQVSTKIAVVGDESLKTCINLNITFDYGVFDSMTKRKTTKISKLPEWNIFEASNPQGLITHTTVDIIKKLLVLDKGLLKIDGEEDLLSLVFILLLPLNSIVLYGQPDKGIVVVDVNELTKDRWYNFLLEADKIAAE